MTRRSALGLLCAVAQGPRPGPRDACPVCGMLVAEYPQWVATVVWRDGRAAHFDGAKDMFKYLRDLGRYAAGKKMEQVAAVWVTEFYDLKRVEGRGAFYVAGSDVTGPMGHELVPFATREDALEFLKDHKGRRVLRFEEVTRAVVEQVDAGRF